MGSTEARNRLPRRPPSSRPKGVLGFANQSGALAAMIAALASTASIAWCAAPGDTNGTTRGDLSELSLEELMEIPVQTINAASRHSQSVRNAPASVTVMTADQIARYGYRTLADVLRAIRGLYVTSDRNYQYIGVRGLGLPDNYSSRVLLLVNGHRINDAVYDSMYLGNDFIIDVALIDRVEFVPGPGSALYGSNAFLGVINVVTKRGRDYQTLDVGTSVGSFASYTGRATYGSTPADGTDVLVSGSGLTSDGQTLFFPAFAAPETQGGFARNADGERAGSGFASLGFRDLRLDLAYVDREKHVPTGSFGTTFGSTRTRTDDERSYLDLSYAPPAYAGWDFDGHVFVDQYRYRGEYDYATTLVESSPSTMERDDADAWWWGSELLLARELFDRLRLTVGGEYRDNIRVDQSVRNVGGGGEFVDENHPSQVWGVLGQAELEVMSGLSLDAGLRYDHYETFGGTISPRLALIATPFTNSVLRASYGQAFRAPSAYEVYYGCSNTDGACSLRPETIHTYELGWDQYMAPWFRSTVVLFYNDIHDLILQTTDEQSLATFGNLSNVTGKGISAEIDARAASGWEARIAETFQRTEDNQTHHRLTNSPAHLVKLGGIAPLVRERLFLGAEALFLSSRLTLSGDHTADAFVVDATLSAPHVVGGLSLQAGAYNLFDTRYADPGGNEHPEDQIAEDGVAFRVEAEYRF